MIEMGKEILERLEVQHTLNNNNGQQGEYLELSQYYSRLQGAWMLPRVIASLNLMWNQTEKRVAKIQQGKILTTNLLFLGAA